ncbi:hypothetical protein ACIQ6V_24150 [Streptomyces sp. NPDC096198]|uniref:hypothetical protein n=1 Tax=Streptomyces sp. NPDC096198 TaxID=3366080 RepID=UPI00382B2D03
MLLARCLDSFSPTVGGREFTPASEDIEELRKLAPAAAKYFTDRQNSLLAELVELVSVVQGVPLLATTAFLTQFRAWGSYYEPDSEPNALDHEIFAAVVAGQKPHSGRSPNPTDLLNAIRLTKEIRNTAQVLSEALQLTVEQPSTSDALKTLTIQRWLTVRGASVSKFSQALANEFTLAYSGQFANKLGFRYGDLENLARHIRKKWRGDLRDANSASWAHATKIVGQRPETVGEASPEWRYHYYQALLWVVPLIMSFSVSDLDTLLSDPAGKYSSRATAIMRHLGSEVGTWENAPGPLGDSPIRTRPFLIWSIGGDGSDVDPRALLINPGALDVDMASTMEALLNREFPKNWSQKRAQVVDEYAVRLLSERLPGCRKASGLYVRDLNSNQEFEMDGLVVSGEVALIAEGKGAPLKLASLRGDVKRLLSQFDGLITEAWGQLQRDREALFGSTSSQFRIVRSEGGDSVADLRSRLASVKKIYPVIPTLDGLGEAGSNLSMLYGLGILPDQASPWIVSVPDLALVVETLRNAPEFISYLRFREKWSRHPQVRVHDEIEMLAMFLEGTNVNFRLGLLEGKENGLAYISGGQARFDDYYAYLNGDGPVAERPRKKMTPRVRRVLDGLMRVKPEGWLDAAVAFLSTSMADALAVDEVWSSIDRNLRSVPWVHRGDSQSCTVAIRSDFSWAELFADDRVLGALKKSEIVWFARCDLRNRLRLEWASFGPDVKEVPRWDF